MDEEINGNQIKKKGKTYKNKNILQYYNKDDHNNDHQ
jgi:hypothetical protein